MEFEKLTQKSIMQKIFTSPQTYVVGSIFSLLFFFALLDSFQTYTSEMLIMVNAKSAISLNQQTQIVSNIVELPTTVAFYNRLLKTNPDIRDIFANYSLPQKKVAWNKMLSVERTNLDGSIIRVAITTKLQSDAEKLTQKVVRTIFDSTAFYYDVQKDLDLRIIDETITRVQISHASLLIVLSLLLGFFVSGIVQFVLMGNSQRIFSNGQLSKVSSFFDFKKNFSLPQNTIAISSDLSEIQSIEEPYVFEQAIQPENSAPEVASEEVINENFQEIKKITKKLEPSKYPNFPEVPVASRSVSGAPSNLPVADDEYYTQDIPQFGEIQPIALDEILPVAQEEKIDSSKEPTPEQLKARLNQLLRGK
jgi:hypothetical protein